MKIRRQTQHSALLVYLSPACKRKNICCDFGAQLELNSLIFWHLVVKLWWKVTVETCWNAVVYHRVCCGRCGLENLRDSLEAESCSKINVIVNGLTIHAAPKRKGIVGRLRNAIQKKLFIKPITPAETGHLNCFFSYPPKPSSRMVKMGWVGASFFEANGSEKLWKKWPPGHQNGDHRVPKMVTTRPPEPRSQTCPNQ